MTQIIEAWWCPGCGRADTEAAVVHADYGQHGTGEERCLIIPSRTLAEEQRRERVIEAALKVTSNRHRGELTLWEALNELDAAIRALDGKGEAK